ncbi:MAG: hypothetical protein WB762_03365 [Candidatus Sulfotelmatobacter sp.]
MAPLVRRSILKKFLIVVSWTLPVCVLTPPASAQYAAGHTAGGEVHISASPIPHISISLAPIIHAPIIHAPISAPRISVTSSAGALGIAGFRPPRRPIRPFPPVLVVYESPFLVGGPFWGLNSCWWATCDLFWPWTLDYTTVSSPGPTNYISQVYETPIYVYGEERPDLPQLFLKDGTVLNVTDYWLIDDQLHFAMIDEVGTKAAEHVIPFEALDLQTTVDANTRRGFRFMLRNEPFEQYLHEHPEGSPPAVTPPH